MRDTTRANAGHASATSARCATFDPLPGRVLTTVTITQASDGAVVLVARDLERYELREALPALDGVFPRGEYRYTLEAKVV